MDTNESGTGGSANTIPAVASKKLKVSESSSLERGMTVALETTVTEAVTSAPEVTPTSTESLEVDGNGKKVSEDSLKQIIEAFPNFDGFEFKRILCNSADAKRVIVEAGVGESGIAVVVLDKTAFTEQTVQAMFTKDNHLNRTFQNDIYGSYFCDPVPAVSAVKTTIVYPATEKHVEKYLMKPLHIVIETPEVYEKVTLPFLESSVFSIDWVYNVLEHKSEADRIVYEDPDPVTGFILSPDLKWDGSTLENLYLLAIVHQKGIKSLRDLTADHIPLLENMLAAGTKAIEDKYGLKSSSLRIYLHYQPSYYHLHVHFTSLQFMAPGNYAEKSHILQSVIRNIKAFPNYYQQASLPFVVKQGEKLYNALENYGYKF